MTEQYRGDESLDDNDRLTLDLVGLSDEEKAEGAILMGGDETEYVVMGDDFEYSEIGNVVFPWGDPKSEQILNDLIEQAEVFSDDYFPLGISTVINDSIWSLSLQAKEFDPDNDFESADQYVLMPYDQVRGQDTLVTFLGRTPPRPELLGKIGNRWIGFGPGANLNEGGIIGSESFSEDLFDQAEFSQKEVLFVLQSEIRKWGFEKRDVVDNNQFAINIAHWVLETFGHQYEGDFRLYPGTKDIPGQELPSSLQQLVTYVDHDELALTNNNGVRMETKHDFIEIEPVVPNWEYIKTIPAFNDQVDYVNSHPEIVAGLQMVMLEVTPQVRLIYQVDNTVLRWGLEFLVSRYGVRVAPFGREGETWGASRYVVERQDNPRELAKTVCELSLLAARYCSGDSSRKIPASAMNSLFRRINHEENIPICKGRHIAPNPANSIKNKLIDRILHPQSIHDDN